MTSPDVERITVRCPCSAKLKVPATAAGRKIRCPKCKEAFTVPAMPAPKETVEPAAEPAADPSDGLSVMEQLVQQERTATTKSAPEPAQMKTSCPGCGAAIPGNAALCVQCGYNLQTGKQTKEANLRATKASAVARKLASGAGGFALGCILSAVGALIGAAVWALIAIVGELEIGFIACLIGFLAGAGMVLGYREKNQRAGVVAAGIAVLGIGAARVIMILFFLSAEIGDFVDTREFQQMVLSTHLAQLDFQEQNLPPWNEDAWWELLEQKQQEELGPLNASGFAHAWESFEDWSSDVKWQDEDFVRSFLIDRLAQQGLPEYTDGEPPISLEEWEERCRAATTEADAMSTAEQVQRAKELKREGDVPLDIDEISEMLEGAVGVASILGAQEEIGWTRLFVDHPLDLLFIGLALVGAFRIASGSEEA